MRPCEFRPTSVAGEAADNLGQFKPITITNEGEKVEKTTQFEQSRALVACELKRGGQGLVA